MSQASRFCEVSNSAKVGSLVPVWTPSCVKKILTAQRAFVRMSRKHRPVVLQCSRKIQMSFTDTDREKQLATVLMLGQHSSDAALIRKCVKHVMEKKLHSSSSEHSMPQSGRPPREIRISLDLGLLKPIKRGF